jgi:hypothetical protein
VSPIQTLEIPVQAWTAPNALSTCSKRWPNCPGRVGGRILAAEKSPGPRHGKPAPNPPGRGEAGYSVPPPAGAASDETVHPTRQLASFTCPVLTSLGSCSGSYCSSWWSANGWGLQESRHLPSTWKAVVLVEATRFSNVAASERTGDLQPHGPWASWPPWQ